MRPVVRIMLAVGVATALAQPVQALARPGATPAPAEPCLFAHGGLDAGDWRFERVSGCLRRPGRLSFSTSPNYENCTGPVRLTRIKWTRWDQTAAVGTAVDRGMQAWCHLWSTSKHRQNHVARVRLTRPRTGCGTVYYSRIRVKGRNWIGQRLDLRNQTPWKPRC